jgi:elongator complex protein 1
MKLKKTKKTTTNIFLNYYYRYLLSVLMAYVKKSSPELDTALQRIKDLRDAGDNNPSVSAEEALKYLLFLVDVNELYDVAIGTYDFDLVVMVAEKSQKDPKEYLPFLNNLRVMESNYQKYSIDRYLKRYHKALQHISKCGRDRFSEGVTLIKEQRLYSEALKLHPITSQEYKEIAVLYGDYLSERRHYEEAAIMYCKAEEWEMALKPYTENLSWRQAMALAGRLEYGVDRQTEMARTLADKLKEVRRHEEASCLLREYAEDLEEAIVTLIEGSLWDEAIRLMYRHRRTDFLETNLKPALEECVDAQMTSLDVLQEEFTKYTGRLTLVRQEKER